MSLQFDSNGKLIFKDDALVFDCDCCGGEPSCDDCCVYVEVELSGFTGPRAHVNGLYQFQLDGCFDGVGTFSPCCAYPMNATLYWDPINGWNFFRAPAFDSVTADVAGPCDPSTDLTGSADYFGKHGSETATIEIRCLNI